MIKMDKFGNFNPPTCEDTFICESEL